MQKKTIKAWAVVSKKHGGIKYMKDSYYSPEIYSSKQKADWDGNQDVNKGYKIVPITITYKI